MKDIKLARLLVLFESETKGLKRDLAEAERGLGRITAFIKANPIAAFGALGAAAVVAGLKAVEMARAFDVSARKIAATVPGATSRVEDLKKAADRLATSKGLSSEQVLGGLSEIAKQGVTSLEALVARFEVIQRLADATGEDFNSLAAGVDQVLDVFGLADDRLEGVAARLTQIAAGRFPVADLFAAFQSAAPTLKKAGISFDDGAAALGRFVASGLNAKQSAAALKDEVERLGAKGLGGVTSNAQDAAEALEDFRSRAALVANSSSRQAAQLQAAYEQATHRIGAAFDKNLWEPLQAGIVLLANFKALRTLALSGGSDIAGAVAATIDTSLPPNSGHVTGHPGRLGPSPAKLPLTAEEQAAAVAALEKLRDKAVKTFTSSLPDTIDATGHAIEGLSLKLIALGTPSAEVAEKLKPLLDRLRELGDRALAVQIEEAVSRGPEQAIERLQSIRQSLVDTLGIDQSGAEAQATLQKIANVDAQIEKVNQQLVQDYKAQAAATDDVLDNTEDVPAALKKTHASLKEILANTADVARGALGIAQAFGVVDDSVASALSNVINIADALPGALSGDLSSIVNVAGSLTGLLSGLFGESADAKHDRELRQQNTQALRELTATLSDQVAGKTVGSSVAAIDALLGSGRNFFKGITGGQPGLDKGLVDQLLGPFGLTLQELQDQLKLINPNLNLNTSSALDFVASLKEVQAALAEVDFRAFADSFAGKLSFLQLQLDLLDLTNPIDQLTALQALASSESPIVQQLLGSLDLTSAQGRAEAQKQLLLLLEKLRTPGGLSGTDLGSLSSAELADLIRQIEGLLDAVDSSTTGSGSTTNFTAENRITETTGQRLAGIAETQLAVQRDILAALTGTFTPVTPPSLPAPIPYTGGLVNGMATEVTVNFYGPVGDPAAAGKQVATTTAAELDALLGQMMQRRMAQLGRV